MMHQSYLNWSELYQDVDITADWSLLEKLTGTIRNSCRARVAQPVYARMSCFWF
jgi:hypothetical protein